MMPLAGRYNLGPYRQLSLQVDLRTLLQELTTLHSSSPSYLSPEESVRVTRVCLRLQLSSFTWILLELIQGLTSPGPVEPPLFLSGRCFFPFTFRAITYTSGRI